jgi:hypothetical protein
MTTGGSTLAARLASTLTGPPAPVPVLTGPCGTGRTAMLLRVQSLLGCPSCQYVDVERIATTPERFLRALVADSPFRAVHIDPSGVKGPREAFDASLAFLSSACTRDGRPATFLLDEVLDLRTFESFPGLRTVVPDLCSALESSPNRFLLATRFSNRAARLVARARGRLAVTPLAPMTAVDVTEALARTPHRSGGRTSDEELARTVLALTDGRPWYVRALLDAMSSMADHGGADPVGALVALFSDQGSLSARCRFCYELRLHRARGYGALKAILDVLADEEPLTLTGVSQRLGRTPGSTKDYLGWLEDVDLVVAEKKRYRIADPLLRIWIRLHSRPAPPSEETTVRAIQRFAMLRLAAAAKAEASSEAAAAVPAAPHVARPPETTPIPDAGRPAAAPRAPDTHAPVDRAGAPAPRPATVVPVAPAAAPARAAALASGRPRSSGIVEFD